MSAVFGPELMLRAYEDSDDEKMTEIRARVDANHPLVRIEAGAHAEIARLGGGDEVAKLKARLAEEESRRARYQAVDAAARRYVEAERASLGKSSADEFALLTAAVDA